MLFGAFLYLRLNGGDAALRTAIAAASLVMAAAMIWLVGRDGGPRR